jgi:hypothetical protein
MVMKTTLYISDELYRQAKAKAALMGKTLRAFIEESIAEKLKESPIDGNQKHWLDQLPRLPKDAVEELSNIINSDEFREIDQEMWE